MVQKRAGNAIFQTTPNQDQFQQAGSTSHRVSLEEVVLVLKFRLEVMEPTRNRLNLHWFDWCRALARSSHCLWLASAELPKQQQHLLGPSLSGRPRSWHPRPPVPAGPAHQTSLPTTPSVSASMALHTCLPARSGVEGKPPP